MTNTLDVQKLTKVCGLLASTSDGERAVAAAMATKILSDAGMNWAAVITAAFAKRAPETPKPQPKPAQQYAAGKTSSEILHDLIIPRVAGFFTPWEENFIDSLSSQEQAVDYWDATAKQWAILDRLTEKAAKIRASRN